MKLLLAILASTAALLGPAHAQGFNIDVGAQSLFGIPDADYGAAAGQPGPWNSFVPGSLIVFLQDTEAGFPGVSISSTGGNPFQFNNAQTDGSDQALLDDILDPLGGVSWTIVGLDDGDYELYTYAWAPDNATYQTNVSVPGSPDPLQTTGGTWSGMHEQGVTYAVHRFEIVDGATLSVDVAPTNGLNLGSVNGFQIVPAQTGNAYCFGDGGDQLGCTDCPCGNTAAPGSQGGCLNDIGASAELIGSGVASLAEDTLRFIVESANPNNFGILTSADNRLPASAANPCFGLDSGVTSAVLNGLRCIGGNLVRHGARPSDANGDIGVTTNGWGPPNGPAGGLADQGGFAAGQTRHFQSFYRELGDGSCTTGQNTTNGFTVTFGP